MNEFLDKLSSPSPTPGGGGASALAGALAASLGLMVGNLTLNNKRYNDNHAEIAAINANVTAIRDKLYAQIQADADAFEPLAAAYKIPKDDPERGEKFERALIDACEPPLKIMRLCAEYIEFLPEYVKKGAKSAVSDAGAGAVIAAAALRAASLNVFINAKSMSNRDYAENVTKEAEKLIETSNKAFGVFNEVKNQLCNS